MLIKKIIHISFLVLIASFTAIITYGIDISASSAVVINADSKEIIYERNAFVKRSMASTTKIMTALIALESGRLNDKVTVSSTALTEGTSVGLKEGYELRLIDLVYGMMLESGNDAANVCALHLGGNFKNFAVIMNNKASAIGMMSTNFVTPSGLDAEDHYSTAYDMALLGAYSIKNPAFRDICSEKSREITFIKPEITVTFSNHNKLLSLCEGVFGIKTGFTQKSGRCLVSACERDGATLICVTLNAGDDWNDHQKLYDMSFAELNKRTVKLSEISEISVYGAESEKVEIFSDEYVYHFTENNNLKKQIIIPQIIYAPIEKNEIIGKINYYSEKTLVHTSYIYSKSDVQACEETYKQKFNLLDWIIQLFLK